MSIDRALWVLCLVMVASVACKRAVQLPTEEVARDRITPVADTEPTRRPSPGMEQVLGNGWYANVEIDSDDNLHFAWTDADVGDVLYAMVKHDAELSGPASLKPERVEVRGAVGSYLRLAVGPANAPVLSYYHQTERTLRLAHRLDDEAKMKAAGVQVDAGPPPALPPGVTRQVDGRMGPGWVGEDVTFGDNVGLASSLVLDDSGFPHIAYYARGERMRYARRPAGSAAFGSGVTGRWQLLDVDEQAGASYTMSTDLAVLPSGDVIVSFCHWNYVDAQLKVGRLAKGKDRFDVLAFPMEKLVDGWHSSILPRDDDQIDVFSVATADRRLLRATLKPASMTLPEKRDVIADRPGAAVVRRGPDGTLWVLTRGLGLETIDEKSGIWLIEVPDGDQSRARRLLLDVGTSSDPWVDLALTKAGKPVAVWTSADHRSMRVYRH